MNLTLTGPLAQPQSGTPQSLLVLLHGYGSDGEDLISLAPLFADLLPEPLAFAPNAPERCPLNPMGYQWFELDMVPDFTRIEGLVPAAETVRQMLAQLWAETGLGPDRTILGGFSQGAMLTLYAGLTLDTPLAGLVAFSGGLPFDQTFWPEITAEPPILLVHGDHDPVVPANLSLETYNVLVERGHDISRHVSPNCPHAIAPDGIEAARAFISAHAPAPKSQT